MAQIIKTTGETLEVSPKKGKHFKLDEMQKIVGGLIEIVEIYGGRLMILNEEGKLNGLAFNPKATLLYRLSRETTDIIVGDVLVCKDEEVQ